VDLKLHGPFEPSAALFSYSGCFVRLRWLSCGNAWLDQTYYYIGEGDINEAITEIVARISCIVS
jgi:hypothetical protein